MIWLQCISAVSRRKHQFLKRFLIYQRKPNKSQWLRDEARQMQIRHREHIFSRGGDKREEQTQGERHAVSLGAFSWELDNRLKPERSWVGSKVAFRSLWYTGICIKWSGDSLSLNSKKIQVPCSCGDRKMFEHRLWAKPGSVSRKSSAQCSWFLSQNHILGAWTSKGWVVWACLVFLLSMVWPHRGEKFQPSGKKSSAMGRN